MDYNNIQLLIFSTLSIVGCSDSFSDSSCTTDCPYWVGTYGCNNDLPSYCSTSGKVKEYCRISCKNCGRLWKLRVNHVAKIIITITRIFDIYIYIYSMHFLKSLCFVSGGNQFYRANSARYCDSATNTCKCSATAEQCTGQTTCSEDGSCQGKNSTS